MPQYVMTNMSGIKSHKVMPQNMLNDNALILVNRKPNKITNMEIVLIKQSQMVGRNKVNQGLESKCM